MQVQLRSDLEQSRQQYQGKTYLVVKDPVTRRYFRFTEAQAAILEFLNTPIDAETLAARATEKLGSAISTSTIDGFLGSLEAKFLLDTPSVREKLGTTGTAEKLKTKSILYWRAASVDPEWIFNWLGPRTRWAFTPAFQVVGICLIVCGFTITYIHWDRLMASTPSLDFSTVLLVWPIMLTVSAYHEFSHGLTCRHFGGKVNEVGFMLIYFSPAFYCDVSDSWMFPSARNRMLVTLAGGYSQLILWGLCAVIWRITDSESLINQTMLVVVLFSGFQTLMNFNPLIKLDGYYMLSDYLEVPNLRAKSFSALWNRVSGKKDQPPFREQRAQLIYGIAAIVFSTTLLVYVYTGLYRWSTSNWALAGFVGFAMFSTFTLRKAAAESMTGLKAVASRTAVRKFRNLGIALALLIISIVGHWELKIPAEFKILPQGAAVIQAESDGVIDEMLAREGLSVRKGDVLVRLRNFDKRTEVAGVAGQLQEKKTELALLMAGTRPEEIDRQRQSIETKKTELLNTRRNQEQRNQLQEKLRRQKSQLELDQQNLDRNRKLYADGGLIPKVDVERTENAVKVRQGEILETEAEIRVITESADRNADLKEKELAEAESGLRLMLAGNRPELIHQKQAEIDKVEAQLKILNQQLDKSEIRSPIDGVVTTPFPERRILQFVEAGDELLRISDAGRVMAEMLVGEKDLADVHPGNTVWMKVSNLPNQSFEGHVDFIAHVAHSVDGKQMFTVRAILPNDSGALKPDTTGYARIYAGERRIIDLVTRRFRRWIGTEFWHLVP